VIFIFVTWENCKRKDIGEMRYDYFCSLARFLGCARNDKGGVAGRNDKKPGAAP
jgi:hypothetical protein